MHSLELRSPLLLVIETTNKCNLNCKYCYNKLSKVETTELDLETFIDLVDEAIDMNVFDINISGGEPFLHKNILTYIDIIVKNNIGISIVSNGTLIDTNIAEALARLNIIQCVQISFDCHKPEIHNLTRDGFNKAYSGFMNLVKRAKNKDLSPSIGIVINKHNYNYIPDMIEYFSNHTSRFHIMNVMKHPELSMNEYQKTCFENEVLPKLKDFVENRNISISILNNKYKKLGITSFQAQEAHIDCLAGFTSLVIASNLEIYPCDVARHPIGKWTKKGSLLELYNSCKNMWRERKEPWCLSEIETACS